ncbi:hypothetical protein SprV_0200664500 [Sparganum proliferum]
MDYGTLVFQPDSYMARRGGTRPGAKGQYHRPNVTKCLSPVSVSSGQHDDDVLPSPVSHFINEDSDNSQTSFGDLFTAVLGSKLSKQSPRYPRISPASSPLRNSDAADGMSPPDVPKPVARRRRLPPYLEPAVYEYRASDEREQLLDTRCLRLIRKLRSFSEFRDITLRFPPERRMDCAGDTSEANRMGLSTGRLVEQPVGDSATLRPTMGIRAYIIKALQLREPRLPQAISQPNLLLPPSSSSSSWSEGGDSSPLYQDRLLIDNEETSDALEQKGMGSHNTRREICSNDGQRSPAESSEAQKYPETESSLETDGAPLGRCTSTTVRSLSPETLIRRLARSITFRVSHRRLLHQQAEYLCLQFAGKTEQVRELLRGAAECLPRLKSDADIVCFRVHPAASALASEGVDSPRPRGLGTRTDVRLCRVTEAPQLPPGCRAMLQDTLTNILIRFDRLHSSQLSVISLLCQLTRRIFETDRRIAALTSSSSSPSSCPSPAPSTFPATVVPTSETMKKSSLKANEQTMEIELDAELFPLQSKRGELETQIAEARRLQNDLEHTKSRLLSGLQHQFFVFTSPDEEPLMAKSEVPAFPDALSSPEDKGRISRARPDADTETSLVTHEIKPKLECTANLPVTNTTLKMEDIWSSSISLAEFVANYLTEHVQTHLNKLILEIEIADDKDIIDSIGEHLRLVSSLSP